MRSAIIGIADMLPHSKTNKIQGWLIEQYARAIECDGEFVTLQDTSEHGQVLAVDKAVDSLRLQYKDIMDCILVPVMDKQTARFVPLLELSSSFIRRAYSQIPLLSVGNFEVVKDGEVVNNQGSDFHIEHQRCVKKGKAVMYYINTTYDEHLNQSFVLTVEEALVIRQKHIDIKYGGLNPFTDEEWQEVYQKALLLRLYREAAKWPYATDNLTQQAIETVRESHKFDNLRFAESKRQERSVYRGGYKVGEFVSIFSDEDKATVQKKSRPVMAQVIQIKPKPTDETKDVEASPIQGNKKQIEDIKFDGLGGF